MAQFLPLQSKHSNKLGKIKAFCILFQVISEFWVCMLCTQHQKSIWETTADQIVALSRLYVLFHVSFYICKEIRVSRCIFEIILETNFFRNASFADLLSKKYETIRNLVSAEVILSLVFLGKKESFLNPHIVIGLPCEFTLKKNFSLLFRKSYWSLRPNFRVIVSKPKYCTHNSQSRRDENIFCISMSK